MKTVFFLILLAAAPILVSAQQATVRTVQGVHIYVYSEPSRPYEVVGTVSTVDMANAIAIATSGDETQPLSDCIRAAQTNAAKKVQKGKMTAYDALIFDDKLETATCIRYKPDPDATATDPEN